MCVIIYVCAHEDRCLLLLTQQKHAKCFYWEVDIIGKIIRVVNTSLCEATVTDIRKEAAKQFFLDRIPVSEYSDNCFDTIHYCMVSYWTSFAEFELE